MAGPAAFLVPHSDPQHKPERVERYSYGWCHGPAGDAQAFRLLAQVTGDPAWHELAGRCWHTVTRSGLPERLRPGFWDNGGRCCGTAGVLALACDRHVEQPGDLSFANILAADLATQATVDTPGARWSSYEHMANPSTLAPRADGQRTTPASSGNCCATHESTTGKTRTTPSHGQTSRPQHLAHLPTTGPAHPITMRTPA